MTEQPTSRRQRARGVVQSDKMEKTVTVAVERLVKHPLYGKYMRRRSRFMAHNPGNYAKAGDLVEIESTRPLSRRKRWRVVRILERAALEALPQVAAEPEAEAPGTEPGA